MCFMSSFHLGRSQSGKRFTGGRKKKKALSSLGGTFKPLLDAVKNLVLNFPFDLNV